MRHANPSDEGDDDHAAAMFWRLPGLCRNDQQAQKHETCESDECRSDSIVRLAREAQSRPQSVRVRRTFIKVRIVVNVLQRDTEEPVLSQVTATGIAAFVRLLFTSSSTTVSGFQYSTDPDWAISSARPSLYIPAWATQVFTATSYLYRNVERAAGRMLPSIGFCAAEQEQTEAWPGRSTPPAAGERLKCAPKSHVRSCIVCCLP